MGLTIAAPVKSISDIIAVRQSSQPTVTPNAAASQTIAPVQPPARESLPFTGLRSGVQLAPPPYIDLRYRISRQWSTFSIGTDNTQWYGAWYTVTPQKVHDFLVSGGKLEYLVPAGAAIPDVADINLFPAATYPPDMPLLQLALNGNLCFWDFPPVGVTGRSFVDWDGFLQAYNADGSASFSNYTYAAQGVDWLATYIQYYINKYLKAPYDVTALIPYGYCYFDQMRLDYNTDDKMEQFLSYVNFLKQPVGTKSFWDDVLNAAPTIVGGIISVATLGLGTPALVAALGAVALKIAQTNLNNTQVLPAANQQAYTQQVTNTAGNVNTTAELQTVAQAAGNSLVTNAQANPILYIAIAIVVILVIAYIAKQNAKHG